MEGAGRGGRRRRGSGRRSRSSRTAGGSPTAGSPRATRIARRNGRATAWVMVRALRTERRLGRAGRDAPGTGLIGGWRGLAGCAGRRAGQGGIGLRDWAAGDGQVWTLRLEQYGGTSGTAGSEPTQRDVRARRDSAVGRWAGRRRIDPDSAGGWAGKEDRCCRPAIVQLATASG